MSHTMPAITLPDEFRISYSSFEKFPCLRNTQLRKSHGISELESLYNRLRERSSKLFVSDEETHVPVRDIKTDGKVEKNNHASDDEICQWLGIASNADTNTKDPSQQVYDMATKKDPPCRIMYGRTPLSSLTIWLNNWRFSFLVSDSVTEPLKISLKSLQRIFTFHQISPNFLEFLDVYGMPEAEDQEMRFCGFRTEVHLWDSDPASTIPDLNRSGRRYDVCYNLKTVKRKDKNSRRWKIRQEAIYHQFDIGTGTQCWVFGDPHAAMKERLSRLFHESLDHSSRFSSISESFNSSLDVHMEAARWSNGDWRSHMACLEKEIQELVILLGLQVKW